MKDDNEWIVDIGYLIEAMKEQGFDEQKVRDLIDIAVEELFEEEE